MSPFDNPTVRCACEGAPAIPRAGAETAFCTPDDLATFTKPFADEPFPSDPPAPLKRRSRPGALAPSRAKRGHRPKARCRWKDHSRQARLEYAARAASLEATKPTIFVTTNDRPGAFVRKLQRHFPNVVGFGVYQHDHGHYALCVRRGSPEYHHLQNFLCHRYEVAALRLWQKKSGAAANLAVTGYLPRRVAYMRRHLNEADDSHSITAGVVFIGGLREKAVALADADYKQARRARRRVRESQVPLAPIPAAPEADANPESPEPAPPALSPEVAAMLDRDKDMLLRVIHRRHAVGDLPLPEVVHRVVAAWPTVRARDMLAMPSS